MKHAILTPISQGATMPAPQRWVRRPWQLLSLLVLGLLLSGAAQASTVVTVGVTGGDFPTIGTALAAVPSPLMQPYELLLLDASYTEDVLLTHTGSVENTLTIRPKAGVSTVLTGTVTFGAGSRYITLSGNNGTLSRALTVRQPDELLSTVVFTGDASFNQVREAVVQGSNTSLSSGVVYIGNGVAGGNDNNTLTRCFVSNVTPALLPANLVYAASTGGGMNDAFELSSNQLFNFSRTGVLVAAGNGDQWKINGNSFFYNLSSLPTTAQTAIDFRPGSGANSTEVRNNFIGGRAVGATGGTWENNGSQSFRGIVMNCGNSTSLINEVSGNVVSGVSLTGMGSASLTAFNVDGGRSELTANTVGTVSNTGTSGVNSLVSRASTVLSSFSVSSGQLMVVENGLTVVLGNLTNAGVLNHTGGDIIIQGDFANSGTFVQTAGDIEIKGDMLNSGFITCSTGKVKLTGNRNQTVSGGTFFNLEVNGTGVKTLTEEAVILNGVQMLTGILNTDSYRIRLGTLANLSETNTSYVLGRVDATRSLSANVLEDFGGMGLLMTPAAGSTLPGATQVSRITGTAPVGVGGNQGIRRYFNITAPTSSGLNLTMTMNYLAHELNGHAPADLVFFRSVNAGSTWQNMGRSSTGSNSVTLTNVSGFSRWTLGSQLAPLPVGLTAFRAERQGRNALLSWTTATELNNRGFWVEVSTNGKDFQALGFVAAERANSSSTRSYSYVDASEGKAGLRYYRLRQEDLNGDSHLFAPQVLRFEGSAPTLAAYPTQFADAFDVELASALPATAKLRLLDGMGREVWHGSYPAAAGAAPLRVQPACAAGTYLLTAEVAGKVLQQRVVKQ